MATGQSGAISEYDSHNLGILDEPVKLVAKASGGFRSGVVALTETRLVYLRKNRMETFIDRASQLRAITDVKFKKVLGRQQLDLKDDGVLIIYTYKGDDLEPLAKELKTTITKHESGRGKYDGYDLGVLGEPITLVASASGGFRSGVIALTKTRLVYVRKNKRGTFIDRASQLGTISDVKFKKDKGFQSLELRDDGALVIYSDEGDDLEPFAEVLKRQAKENRSPKASKRDAEQDTRLAGIICSARGRNGIVHVFENKVLISRKGFQSTRAFGFRENKEILISDITSVGWKTPGFTEGYIHFEFAGSQSPIGEYSWETYSLKRNENAVIFTTEHLKDFEQLRKLLEEKRAELRKPQHFVAPVAASPMEELKQLAELKEMGIVSEEEFEAKKKQLLGL